MKMATTGVSIIPNATAKTEVWEHFGYPGNESGSIATKSRVICLHCKKNMPYKNNTTTCTFNVNKLIFLYENMN